MHRNDEAEKEFSQNTSKEKVPKAIERYITKKLIQDNFANKTDEALKALEFLLGEDKNIKKKIKKIHDSIHGGATLKNISNKYRVKMIDGKPIKKTERNSKAESRRKNAGND